MPVKAVAANGCSHGLRMTRSAAFPAQAIGLCVPTAERGPTMEAAFVAFLQELYMIVPREEQFVEPLERLPPMAVRLSGLATSALAGGWPSDPQRRQLDDVQDWLFQLEDSVLKMEEGLAGSS